MRWPVKAAVAPLPCLQQTDYARHVTGRTGVASSPGVLLSASERPPLQRRRGRAEMHGGPCQFCNRLIDLENEEQIENALDMSRATIAAKGE